MLEYNTKYHQRERGVRGPLDPPLNPPSWWQMSKLFLCFPFLNLSLSQQLPIDIFISSETSCFKLKLNFPSISPLTIHNVFAFVLWGIITWYFVYNTLIFFNYFGPPDWIKKKKKNLSFIFRVIPLTLLKNWKNSLLKGYYRKTITKVKRNFLIG